MCDVALVQTEWVNEERGSHRSSILYGKPRSLLQEGLLQEGSVEANAKDEGYSTG